MKTNIIRKGKQHHLNSVYGRYEKERTKSKQAMREGDRRKINIIFEMKSNVVAIK